MVISLAPHLIVLQSVSVFRSHFFESELYDQHFSDGQGKSESESSGNSPTSDVWSVRSCKIGNDGFVAVKIINNFFL